jgi:SAM-dependent methyltransferase
VLSIDRYITQQQREAILDVPHFRDGKYASIDIDQTIHFYIRRYVDQLASFTRLGKDDVVADIGTGYGWLAIAFALKTRARVIAVDVDAERLRAAREIAGIIGVGERIDWRVGSLGRLPMETGAAKAVYCIEVIEHIKRSRAAVRDLARICSDILVITTPNLYFPIIAHDTQLPFCHWLPMKLRGAYAALFGRSDRENDNLFWSPRSLFRELPEFELASGFLHYASRARYQSTFPIYIPYVRGGLRRGDGRLKSMYYDLASRLGRYSVYAMPSLACALRRRPEAHFAVEMEREPAFGARPMPSTIIAASRQKPPAIRKARR